MIRLSLKTDFRDVYRKLSVFPDKVSKPTLARSLNEVVALARTQMRRQITKEFLLSPARVRDRLLIKRANQRDLVAVLSARASGKGRALHLTDFRARDTRWSHGSINGISVRLARRTARGSLRKGKGVEVQVKRAGPKKLLKAAFIAAGANSGKLIVFQRKGKERKPIEALVSIDVPQMFNTKRINNAVTAHARKSLSSIVDRNLKFYLQREGYSTVAGGA